MTKIFSMLDHLLPQPAVDEAEMAETWINDLLRHPDIARMNARELGDLPFPGSVAHKGWQAERGRQAKACHNR